MINQAKKKVGMVSNDDGGLLGDEDRYAIPERSKKKEDKRAKMVKDLL